jgi:uridine kinase
MYEMHTVIGVAQDKCSCTADAQKEDLTMSELHRLEPRGKIQEAERNVIQSFVHGPPREDNCPLTPQAVVVIAGGAILADEGVAANL